MGNTLWLTADQRGDLSLEESGGSVLVDVYPTPLIPDYIRLPAELGGSECRVTSSQWKPCPHEGCGQTVMHFQLGHPEVSGVAVCHAHENPYAWLRQRSRQE